MSMIQVDTNFSNTLDNTGVSEIGLRSLSNRLGGDTFERGTVSPDFHSSGRKPSGRLLLNNEDTGLNRRAAQPRNTQFGMLSGPTAFSVRAFIMSRSTSATLLTNLLGTAQSLAGGTKVSSSVRALKPNDTERKESQVLL